MPRLRGICITMKLSVFFPLSSIVGIEVKLLNLADERVARVGTGALVIESLYAIP